MRLELDRGDLKEGSAETNCSKLIFGDFKDDVQEAIRIVGKATFFDGEGTQNETFQVIRAPR